MLSELDVRCPPGDVEQRIRNVFSANGKVELEVPFQRVGLPAIGKLSRRVTLTLGDAERRSDGATLLPLRWRDADSKSFPEFEGFFEITPLAKDSVQVAIIGDYAPPLGPLGAAFDAAMGRRIAEVTVEELLYRLRQEIEKA